MDYDRATAAEVKGRQSFKLPNALWQFRDRTPAEAEPTAMRSAPLPRPHVRCPPISAGQLLRATLVVLMALLCLASTRHAREDGAVEQRRAVQAAT